MRLCVNRELPRLAPLGALFLLAGCLSGGADRPSIAGASVSGPAADYPMVLGEPFTVGTVTYTPEDKLNYDAVGMAVIEGAATGVAGAHKTLPLPSYVEVTALDSGRTILVRLNERGPLRNDALIGLSPAAASQLGVSAAISAPVRMRRVNPGEQERALLRKGSEAPARMDTPQSLLKVLRRKLPSLAGSTDAPTVPAAASGAKLSSIDPDAGRGTVLPPAKVTPSPAKPSAAPPASSTAHTPAVKPEPKSPQKPKPAATPAAAPAPAAAASGSIAVQVAAFSTEARAQAAAKAVGGFVVRSGKYWYLRTGPFASSSAAQAGLEKARSAGYKDARITRSN